MRLVGTLVAVVTTALVGCASWAPGGARAPSGVAPQDLACLRWIGALDAAVDRAGVRDAEADRIAGFPTLRIDRLRAALAPLPTEGVDAAFDAWLQHLRALDLTGRRVELANLSPAAWPQDVGAAPADRLEACSNQLTTSLRADAAARDALLAGARVPDRYSDLSRALGLYALTRVPFFSGVQSWEREVAQAMRDAGARPHPMQRLVPADPATQPAAATAPPRDPLGLLQLDATTAERLLAAHAPVFEIETNGDFDSVGMPAWRADDARLSVDTAQPVVYRRLSHTLVHGRPLLQLVYTLWFPERPKQGRFDLLGGALDGVIVRLTLAPDGRPLMLDTIHACGCYHLFFPARGVTLRPDAPTQEEWAFAPAALPELMPDSRLAVRLQSATHYVLGVSTAPRSSSGSATYVLRPEAELQRLPLPGGGSRSLYGPDGLVQGSERAERFFYWPMGIASAGAMRQWGHHATAFVGRRHFDDADLLDRRFIFPVLE